MRSNRSTRAILKSGFSVLELLVVVGILSIVALGFGQMLATMSKSQQAVNDKFENTQAVSYAQQLLQSTPICNNLLRGLIFDITNLATASIVVNAVTEGAGATPQVAVLKTAASALTTGVQVENLVVSNFINMNPDRYIARLFITPRRKPGFISEKTKSIALSIKTVAGTGEIESCVALGGNDVNSTKPKSQVWSTPGMATTFVIPENAKLFSLTMVGGGGGGGVGFWDGGMVVGCNPGGMGGAYTGPSGGSGAAFYHMPIEIQTGETISITVGSGGTSRCTGGTIGTPSSIATAAGTHTANGGFGGAAHVFTGGAGAGGTAAPPDGIVGNAGRPAFANCAGVNLGGVGPLSYMGINYGSGGNAVCAGLGGPGQGGYIRLDWWEEE